MNDDLRNIASQAINDQKDIFGDLLFQKIEAHQPVYKSEPDLNLVSEPINVKKENNFFMEDWKKNRKT